MMCCKRKHVKLKRDNLKGISSGIKFQDGVFLGNMRINNNVKVVLDKKCCTSTLNMLLYFDNYISIFYCCIHAKTSKD